MCIVYGSLAREMTGNERLGGKTEERENNTIWKEGSSPSFSHTIKNARNFDERERGKGDHISWLRDKNEGRIKIQEYL